MTSTNRSFEPELWQQLLHIQTHKERITATIVHRNSGGFEAHVHGHLAFIPQSLMDFQPLQADEHYLHQCYEFYIIKLQREQGRIILDRLTVLQENIVHFMTHQVSVGMTVKGTVHRFKEKGMIIHLKKGRGYLRYRDMMFGSLKNPEVMFKLGQEIEAKVIGLDWKHHTVELSINTLSGFPTSHIKDLIEKDVVFTSEVLNVKDYGCFMSVLPHVDGLLHMSKLDALAKIPSVGDYMDVKIESFDPDTKRVSLMRAFT